MYKLNIIFPAPMAELVDATDSKSVELRFMSVRVGLGVPFTLERSIPFSIYLFKVHKSLGFI